MIILTSRTQDEVIQLLKEKKVGDHMENNETCLFTDKYTPEQDEKILSFCTNNTAPDGKSICVRPEGFENLYRDFPDRTFGAVLGRIRTVANSLDIRKVSAEGVIPHMKKKRVLGQQAAEQYKNPSSSITPEAQENKEIIQAMANGVRQHYASKITGQKQIEEKLIEAKKKNDSLSVQNSLLREEIEDLKKQLRIMKKLREAAFEVSREIGK